MEELEFDNIKRDLSNRGVVLNKGVDFDIEKRLFDLIGIYPDKLVSKMFRSFNGFPPGVVDGGSCIRLWSFDEVISSFNSNFIPRVNFGDFMMNSDYLTFDISNSSEPILYNFEGDKLSENITDFFCKLISGKFDFI